MAVLFDFDGVIVNSEPLHLHAFREVLKNENIDLTDAEYYRELIGFDDRGGFAHLFAARKRPLDRQHLARLITQKNHVMMEAIAQGKGLALPGVVEFVRGLRRRFPLAICSGALREEIEAMLDGIGLRDCFPIIVAAQDVEVGKPDPSGYLKCVRLIGEKIGKPIGPGDCLVIEDAPTVVASVKAAGFPTLAVTTSYPAKQLIGADWIISSLRPDEIARHIPELRTGM